MSAIIAEIVVLQYEAINLLEAPADGSQEEPGWEEAGDAMELHDAEEEGCGLSAYATVEALVSEKVRARTILCRYTMQLLRILSWGCGKVAGSRLR